MGIQAQIYVEGVCTELLSYDEDLRKTDISDSERLEFLLTKIKSIKETAAAGWY